MNPRREERRRAAERMAAAGMRLPWPGYPDSPCGTLEVWNHWRVYKRYEPKPLTERELEELWRQHGII